MYYFSKLFSWKSLNLKETEVALRLIILKCTTVTQDKIFCLYLNLHFDSKILLRSQYVMFKIVCINYLESRNLKYNKTRTKRSNAVAPSPPLSYTKNNNKPKERKFLFFLRYKPRWTWKYYRTWKVWKVFFKFEAECIEIMEFQTILKKNTKNAILINKLLV